MYRRAEILTQTRLLMYNKRRSKELEVVGVKDYLQRHSCATYLDKVIRGDLSHLEFHLLETQELIEARGKNGRRVPIILPPDVQPVLEYLTDATVRDAAGVLSSNKYMFPNTGVGVLRTFGSLKECCNEIALEKPQRITSVILRKYTATVSQIHDLNPNQQAWLSNHLGHTLDVHEILYRQTSGIIERVDMAKIMLLAELNVTSKHAGKKLDEIQILPEDGEVAMSNEELLAAEADPEYNPDVYESMTHDEYDFEDDEDDWEEPENKKEKCVRVKWSPNELSEIEKYFKDNLLTKNTLGRRECEFAISCSEKENGVLHLRTWETIKKKVWNMIRKACRLNSLS